MTFLNYMRRNHKGAETGAGKLAGVMASDREGFPRNGPGKFDSWHRLLRKYIDRTPAYAGMAAVFESCREQYEQAEREKRRRYRYAGKAD